VKKLYEVTKRYYIMAETVFEAECINIDFEGEATASTVEATSVDSEWWDEIPFNSDDARTCGQILKGEMP